MRRVGLLAALVVLAFTTGANAQVVLTFAAKRGEGMIPIPHSLLRIGGTTESGEAISRTFGFMPEEGSNLDFVLGTRIQGHVVDNDEAKLEWDRIRPFLSIQIPDRTLDAVVLRFKVWNESENGGYDTYAQNCIAFLADIAATVGLQVPPGAHLSPSGFLTTLAEMNPTGSVPGILAAPVPNPSPADLAPEEADTPSAVTADPPTPAAEPVAAPN